MPPPDKPPSDDEFKHAVYSFIREEPRKRTDEERRHAQLVNAISSLKGEVKEGFDRTEQRFRGLETRVTLLEQDAMRRRPSPFPGSIPAARLKLDTGNYEKLGKEEAQAYLEKRAREIAEEVVEDDKLTEDAGAWRKGVGVLGKVLLLLLAAAISVGSGYALSQCTHPVSAAPAHSLAEHDPTGYKA